jgi:NAD(P)-dependent dehydrogenase (short-subunit alcohol dehydrogenase family)
VHKKTYVVTGGASGTGRSVSDQLSQDGHRVVIWGRTETKLRQAVREGAAVGYHVADLSAPDAVEQAFAAFDKEYGGLDGLVHCAGAWIPGSLCELEPAVLLRHLGAVATSAMLCARAAAHRLVARGGCIVLVAAASGKPGFADTALNVLAKRAVDGLQHGLAHELKGSSCRLTTVYPDSIASADSESVRSGNAMSYCDLARVILFALHAPPTTHVQEILVTAGTTGR